ncbi:MAG: hypothetical protein HGA85_07440 [Nanoarchaeota archaeon]|nr:hypothetical protein [Nanoarchaeota archaeon]
MSSDQSDKTEMREALEAVLQKLAPLYTNPLVLDTVPRTIHNSGSVGELYIAEATTEPISYLNGLVGMFGKRAVHVTHKTIVMTQPGTENLCYAKGTPANVVQAVVDALKEYTAANSGTIGLQAGGSYSAGFSFFPRQDEVRLLPKP